MSVLESLPLKSESPCLIKTEQKHKSTNSLLGYKSEDKRYTLTCTALSRSDEDTLYLSLADFDNKLDQYKLGIVQEEANLICLQKQNKEDILKLQKKKERAGVESQDYIVLNSKCEALQRVQAHTALKIQKIKDKIKSLEEARV